MKCLETCKNLIYYTFEEKGKEHTHFFCNNIEVIETRRKLFEDDDKHQALIQITSRQGFYNPEKEKMKGCPVR